MAFNPQSFLGDEFVNKPADSFDPVAFVASPEPQAKPTAQGFDPVAFTGGQTQPQQQGADSTFEQILGLGQNLKVGAARTWYGMTAGVDRMDAMNADKISKWSAGKRDAAIEKGDSPDGWKVQRLNSMADMFAKISDKEAGWASDADAARASFMERNDDLTQGLISEVAQGVGGMWDIVPSAMSMGLFSAFSSPTRMFDEGYSQAILTQDKDKALDTATAYVFAASPLEMAADMFIFKGKGQATKRAMLPFLKQVAKKMGMNFLSEGSTEVLQDAILNKFTDQKMFTPASLRTFIVSGLVGSIAGGASATHTQASIARRVGELERQGIKPEDAVKVVNLSLDGKQKEATEFLESLDPSLAGMSEAMSNISEDDSPLNDKEVASLKSLAKKDTLSDEEQMQLSTIIAQLPEEEQSIIMDGIAGAEGGDKVFNDLISRLTKQEVTQDATDTTQRVDETQAKPKDGQEQVASDSGQVKLPDDSKPITSEKQDAEIKKELERRSRKNKDLSIEERRARARDNEKNIKVGDKIFVIIDGVVHEATVTENDPDLAQVKAVGDFSVVMDGKQLSAAFMKDVVIRSDEQIGVESKPVAGQEQDQQVVEEKTLKSIKADAKAEGVRLSVTERGDRINLSIIKIPEESRGEGIATKYMNEIIAHADRTGKRVELTPTDEFGADIKRLTKFYEGFGFVKNEGANKDFEISETMFRNPEPTKAQSKPSQPVGDTKPISDKQTPPADAETPKTPKGTPDKGATGISRRMRKIQNDQNGIDNTSPPDVEEQTTLLQNAIEQDINTDILIDELASNPRVLEDIEVAALTIRTAEIVDEIESLKASLDGATEDERSDIESQIGTHLDYLEKVEAGVSAAGTKMGRALAAMNMRLIRGTYDLATSLSRARKKKGSKLTPKDRKTVSKNVDSVDEQKAKIDKILGDESADIFKAKSEAELIKKSNDYLLWLRKAARGIEEQKKTKPTKDKTAQQKYNDQLKTLLKQQDVVIELINQIEGRGLKRPTKKGGKVFDPEGYVAMAKNLSNQIKKAEAYKRYLAAELQKEKTLDDKIAQTTENIEQVKRTIEKETKNKPLSLKQRIHNKLKGVERDQDRVIELQNILNQQIVELSNKDAIVDDPEGLKAMAKNISKMIHESKWWKDAKANPTKVTKKRIAMLEEQIQRLEEQADGMYRDIKKGKVVEEPAIEMLKDRIKFMKEEMRLGDELAVVNEDIRLISEGRYSEVDEIKRRNKKTTIIKGLDKERAELEIRKDTLNRSINELSRNGAGKVFMDVADFLRAMKLSLDTWIGRQGAKTLFSDPKLAASAFKDSMVGSLTSAKFYEAVRQIVAMPTTKHGRSHGLEIMEAGGTFELHQEAMNSKLAEKFPFVRWSNRNMILGIDAMRAKMYQKWYNRYPNESDEFYENVATLINEWTGRGTLGKMEKAAHGLSAAFTAPRWVTSNWQVIASERHAWVKNPKTGKKEFDPRLLKEISTQKAKAALGFGMIASMMIAAGWEFEEDPEEGDFMKLRKGDMVIDIMPGLSSNLRLLGVLAESVGARFGIGELEGRSSFSDVADRYLSYKYAPIIGSAREFITGKTPMGDERRIEETIILSMTPIMLETIYQDYFKDMEDLRDVAKAQGIQWFGFGASIYEDKDL